VADAVWLRRQFMAKQKVRGIIRSWKAVHRLMGAESALESSSLRHEM
jgi:hypothetical protein